MILLRNVLLFSVIATALSISPYSSWNYVLTNSLSMDFVRVPNLTVLVAKTEVSVEDYSRYAAENPNMDMSWKNLKINGVKQLVNHPVTNISWLEAKAFCNWLSEKENRNYRLPTDKEWSKLAGLSENIEAEWPIEITTNPNQQSSLRPKGPYPWGTNWPPPQGHENIGGTKYDQYPFTAPVNFGVPNAFGLYHIGGNIKEMCEDWFAPGNYFKTCRGPAWSTSEHGPWSSQSAVRSAIQIDKRTLTHGFRIVLETESKLN